MLLLLKDSAHYLSTVSIKKLHSFSVDDDDEKFNVLTHTQTQTLTMAVETYMWFYKDTKFHTILLYILSYFLFVYTKLYDYYNIRSYSISPKMQHIYIHIMHSTIHTILYICYSCLEFVYFMNIIKLTSNKLSVLLHPSFLFEK